MDIDPVVAIKLEVWSRKVSIDDLLREKAEIDKLSITEVSFEQDERYRAICEALEQLLSAEEVAKRGSARNKPVE